MSKIGNILIILSEGRSGSSFVAKWLSKCGLYLGDNLKPADRGINEDGFFEDEEIIKFHNNLLLKTQFNNIYNYLGLKNKYTFTAPQKNDFEKANKIIDKRKKSTTPWGWKLPLTNIYWNSLWYPIFKEKTLHNNLFSLFLYRDFNEVIDSSIRTRFVYNTNRLFYLKRIYYYLTLNLLANRILETWIIGNSEILSFCENNKTHKDFLVISLPTLLDNSKLVFDKINLKLDNKLKYIDPNTLFKTQIYNRKSKLNFKLNNNLVLQAQEIQIKLQNLEHNLLK